MKPTIIGIAGGTASGKTTVAKKLYEATKEYGTVSLIRMDDYYKKYKDIPLNDEGFKNFDHPKSYDEELLLKHLQQLSKAEAIDKPTYDFCISERGEETEKIEAGDIIILEGIMTFCIPSILEYLDIKIFVDTPSDIRFIRRLKRDMKERKRDVDSVVLQYLTSVRPMHEAFVEPSKKNAHIIIPEGGHNSVAMDVLITKLQDILNHKK